MVPMNVSQIKKLHKFCKMCVYGGGHSGQKQGVRAHFVLFSIVRVINIKIKLLCFYHLRNIILIANDKILVLYIGKIH